MNENIADEFSYHRRVWLCNFREPFSSHLPTDVHMFTASERTEPTATMTAQVRGLDSATMLKNELGPFAHGASCSTEINIDRGAASDSPAPRGKTPEDGGLWVFLAAADSQIPGELLEAASRVDQTIGIAHLGAVTSRQIWQATVVLRRSQRRRHAT